MHHFSGWAGVAALDRDRDPVVVKKHGKHGQPLVPNGLREAAAALGAPMSFVIRAGSPRRMVRRASLPGCRWRWRASPAKTAPLLFTALNNGMNTNLNTPMASLPVGSLNFATVYEDQHRSHSSALLVTATVLTLSIIARLLANKQRN